MNYDPAIDQTIAKARRAIENDQTEDARLMLQGAARYAPDDPRPWLLMAGIAGSPREQRIFLDQARRLDAQPSPPAVAPAPTVAAGSRSTRRQRRAGQSRRPVWGMWLLVALLVAGLAFVLQPNTRMMVSGAADRMPVLAGLIGKATPTTAIQAVGIPSTWMAPAEDTLATSPTPQPAFPTKDVATGGIAGDFPLPTWTPPPPPTPTLAPTMTPSPTPEPPPTSEAIPLSIGVTTSRPPGVSEWERWISVNLSTQTLVAYEGDNPVFETLISSGLPQWPTVTGQFRTYMKYESQTMNGYLLGYDYFLPDVPFVMYFFEDYAIHGTYWHNSFGLPMSHGCVNVSTPDAEWLFNWAPVGTVVDVEY